MIEINTQDNPGKSALAMPERNEHIPPFSTTVTIKMTTETDIPINQLRLPLRLYNIQAIKNAESDVEVSSLGRIVLKCWNQFASPSINKRNTIVIIALIAIYEYALILRLAIMFTPLQFNIDITAERFANTTVDASLSVSMVTAP
jgi:hypothetical protein